MVPRRRQPLHARRGTDDFCALGQVVDTPYHYPIRELDRDRQSRRLTDHDRLDPLGQEPGSLQPKVKIHQLIVTTGFPLELFDLGEPLVVSHGPAYQVLDVVHASERFVADEAASLEQRPVERSVTVPAQRTLHLRHSAQLRVVGREQGGSFIGPRLHARSRVPVGTSGFRPLVPSLAPVQGPSFPCLLSPVPQNVGIARGHSLLWLMYSVAGPSESICRDLRRVSNQGS